MSSALYQLVDASLRLVQLTRTLFPPSQLVLAFAVPTLRDLIALHMMQMVRTKSRIPPMMLATMLPLFTVSSLLMCPCQYSITLGSLFVILSAATLAASASFLSQSAVALFAAFLAASLAAAHSLSMAAFLAATSFLIQAASAGRRTLTLVGLTISRSFPVIVSVLMTELQMLA